jgi:hypothetical protein
MALEKSQLRTEHRGANTGVAHWTVTPTPLSALLLGTFTATLALPDPGRARVMTIGLLGSTRRLQLPQDKPPKDWPIRA